jgi:hypothetical protein
MAPGRGGATNEGGREAVSGSSGSTRRAAFRWLTGPKEPDPIANPRAALAVIVAGAVAAAWLPFPLSLRAALLGAVVGGVLAPRIVVLALAAYGLFIFGGQALLRAHAGSVGTGHWVEWPLFYALATATAVAVYYALWLLMLRRERRPPQPRR